MERIEPITTANSYEQRLFILNCLKQRPYSTNELRQLGIYYPPSRIKELRKQGYKIDTFMRDEYDNTGLKHSVGVYILHQD